MTICQARVVLVVGTPPARCLIIDDSAAFREAATAMLEGAGLTVAGWASSGDDALRLYRELRPDVTLVDIDLGAESGFEVVELLHRSIRRPTPIILISTHAEPDFADLIAESSAVGFLPKFALSAEAIRALLPG